MENNKQAPLPTAEAKPQAVNGPKARQDQKNDAFADNFFTPVGNTKPFFKAGIQGMAGSGKTYTAAEIAIGLHKRIGSTKPVVFFDTEKAAKFLKSKFNEAGVELIVRESRTLADLITTMKKMEEGAGDILIIDSISHVWEDTVEAFKKKYNRSALQFQDWGVLKPLWKTQFSDRLVTSQLHIFMNGRAGYEYENEINEQTGKREIYKSGVKMKVEGETAYEPDMLVLMERFEEILGKDKKIYRQATVIKDRSQLLDGKTFVNPTYKDFEPVIEDMLENPESAFQDPETDSTGLFHTEEDKYKYVTDKKIALEEIEGQLLRAWPSTGAADKQKKIEAIEKAFGTRSWIAVEHMTLGQLQEGLKQITEMVEAALATQFEGVEKPPKKNAKGAESPEAGKDTPKAAKVATEGPSVASDSQ